MPQNFFEAFREANPHLFGEDSDFSDSDSENGEIEETSSCDICEKGKKMRTRNRCSSCRKYVCSKHQHKTVHFICTNCKIAK